MSKYLAGLVVGCGLSYAASAGVVGAPQPQAGAASTVDADGPGRRAFDGTRPPAANGTDTGQAGNGAGDTSSSATADLSVTVSDGAVTAVPGTGVTYLIRISNAGPDPVVQARVTDNFPPALSCSWTCAGPGTCAPSGTGAIHDLTALPVGATVTYTASCAIHPAATGTLSNSAGVQSLGAELDPNTADNDATDVDTLIRFADVALTLTDDRGWVGVGGTLNYVIRVSNATGPSRVDVTLADPLPAGVDNGSWICIPIGGASCSSGSGNLMTTTASLPVGTEAIYRYTATARAADANDQIINTATVSLTSGVDGDPANDTATDATRLVIFADGFGEATPTLATATGDAVDFILPLSPARRLACRRDGPAGQDRACR